jgi:glycosyltransferase involved in cell wall biosynthesis
MPRLSVMMPAYNTETYIRDAIQSCIDQTYKDWELIVVDDGSTDKTAKVAELMAKSDNRIRVIKSQHGGVSNARNLAVKLSRGEYIARQDSDDTQHHERFEKQMAVFDKNPHLDCVTTGGMIIPVNTNEKMSTRPTWLMHPQGYMTGTASWNSPCNASIIARKDLYNAVQGGFDSLWPVGEDSTWNRLVNCLGARWGTVDGCYYTYRRRKGSLTARDNPNLFASIRPVDKEYWINEWNTSHYRNFEALVTTDCQHRCQQCSMEFWRNARPGYHMPMQEFVHLVDRIMEQGIHLRCFSFTGGEPLLWEHLEDAARLVKESGIADTVETKTAVGDELDGLKLQYPSIDVFQCSVKPGQKPPANDVKRILAWSFKHRALPTEPLPDVLPAACNCRFTTYYDNKVYWCANAVDLPLRHGWPEKRPEWCCDVDDFDWWRHFRKSTPFTWDICSVCLGNRNVWFQQPEVE